MAIAPSPAQVEAEKRKAAQAKKERAQAMERRRATLISQFGESVGRALFEYQNASLENHNDARQSFAAAIVGALETGTSLDKTRAIVALLTYLDEEISPVNKLARETAHRVHVDNAIY